MATITGMSVGALPLCYWGLESFTVPVQPARSLSIMLSVHGRRRSPELDFAKRKEYPHLSKMTDPRRTIIEKKLDQIRIFQGRNILTAFN